MASEPLDTEISEASTAPRPSGVGGHLLAISLALVGGVLGIAGAFVQELPAAAGLLLLPFLGAPIIEEGVKPIGVYILLMRWPHLLRGQLYTAALAGLAGLVFGVLESLVYVKLYVPDPSDAFVTYRFTVPLAVHALASFTVGLGINKGVLAWAKGEAALPKASRNLFIAAVTLHAVFNITGFVLVVTGVVDLD